MLAGGLGTGKAVLRDYIEATIGFTALAEGVGTPSTSLIPDVRAEGRSERGQSVQGSRPSAKMRRNSIAHQLRKARHCDALGYRA